MASGTGNQNSGAAHYLPAGGGRGGAGLGNFSGVAKTIIIKWGVGAGQN